MNEKLNYEKKIALADVKESKSINQVILDRNNLFICTEKSIYKLLYY